MSEITFSAVHEDQKIDSVYDFLYCDTARIASFISQFDEFGALKQVVKKDGHSQGLTSTYKTGVDASAGIVFATGKGSAAFERTPRKEASEISERTYDTAWANALSFLDYVDEKNLINRDWHDANIGQLVLVSGEMGIFDFSTLKQMWTIPSIKKVIEKGARQSHKKENGGAAAPFDSQGLSAALDLLPILPHTVQCTIYDGVNSVWGILKENYMTMSGSEVLLHYGVAFSGTWHMVAIIDSKPVGEEFEAIAVMTASLHISAIAPLIAGFVPAIKSIFGKPATSIGVTPLMIFRKITDV